MQAEQAVALTKAVAPDASGTARGGVIPAGIPMVTPFLQTHHSWLISQSYLTNPCLQRGSL